MLRRSRCVLIFLLKSEFVTGSSMQMFFQMEMSGQNISTKNLDKTKYFPKLADNRTLGIFKAAANTV